MSANYYHILGVAENSSSADIKSAYRNLAKKYHPDLNKSESAADMFMLIEIAYSNLKKPETRAAYDRLLKIRRDKTTPESVKRKFQQDVDRMNRRGQQRAERYVKMTYDQYKKDDYFLSSLSGVIIQAFFTILSGTLIVFSTYLALRSIYGPIESEWNYNVVGILAFGFVPLLMGLVKVYEPLVKYIVIGKPKNSDDTYKLTS